jgi:hypothetical protein
VALALVQFTGVIEPLSDLTRTEKIRALVPIVGVLAALVLASEWSSGGRMRRGGGKEQALAAEGAGR